MLTPAQREQFHRTGLLRLPGAIPRGDTAAMCDRIWDHLNEAHGIVRTDPATWLTGRLSHLQRAAVHNEFHRLGSPAVRTALDDLVGEWPEPRKWGGRLLVTFPDRAAPTWDVPIAVWHNDFMPLPGGRIPRPVQLFVLLNEVKAQGGGTLVLTGSHRLTARYVAETGEQPHPRKIRSTLGAAHPWLRELWTPGADPIGQRVQRFMVEGADVAGVHLQVAELTGPPGDVFVMHCDSFHAAAPNCRDQPRMMATNMIGPDLVAP